MNRLSSNKWKMAGHPDPWNLRRITLMLWLSGLTGCAAPLPDLTAESPRLIGLPNLGNTCFVNASTTFLFAMLDPEYLKQYSLPLQRGKMAFYPRETEQQFAHRTTLAHHLMSLYQLKQLAPPTPTLKRQIREQTHGYLNSLEATLLAFDGDRRVGGFDGARLRKDQGDAFEVASKLLTLFEFPRSGFAQVFEFADGQRKIHFQPDPIVSLGIPTVDSNLDLQTIVDFRLQPQWMTGDNQLANHRGVKEDALLLHGFYHPAPYLVMRLERYGFDSFYRVRKKLDRVAASKTLSIQDLHEGDHRLLPYQLQAVVIHRGQTPGSGHYYTYQFLSRQNRWLIHNDDTIDFRDWKQIEPDIAVNGYLFLYKRLNGTH